MSLIKQCSATLYCMDDQYHLFAVGESVWSRWCRENCRELCSSRCSNSRQRSSAESHWCWQDKQCMFSFDMCYGEGVGLGRDRPHRILAWDTCKNA